jgi:hypothetical protein
MKETLDCHPSVVVAHSPETQSFLFSVYDETYPKKAYRGAANNIGGNPEPFDFATDPLTRVSCGSPSALLIREIYEELDPYAQGPNNDNPNRLGQKVNWASPKDIVAIRDSLVKGLQPMQDFMVRQPKAIPGAKAPYQGIYAVFYTELSGGVIEKAERAVRDKKVLITEGLTGVFTLEELANSERGEFAAAHITAHILNWKFGSTIPHPNGISAEPMGQPRERYSDYFADFNYSNEKLKRASNAED